MSVLMSLTHEVSTQALSAHARIVSLAAGGGDGIINWLTAKNTEVQTLFRAIAITLGVGFVIWQGVASRGAMARIIISIIGAGIFIWGVFNVTDVKDRVGNEVDSFAPVAVHIKPAQGDSAQGGRLCVSLRCASTCPCPDHWPAHRAATKGT